MRDHELEEQVKAAFDSIRRLIAFLTARLLMRMRIGQLYRVQMKKPLSSSLLLRGRSVERP